MLGDPLSAEDREHDQNETDDRGLEDLVGPYVFQIDAHQQRDGDRHTDGECAPRAAFERIGHDQRNHAEQYDKDREHGDEGDGAAEAPDLFTRHLPEGFAVTTYREGEDDEVLHAAAEHG